MRLMLLVTDLQRGGTPLRIARIARGLHHLGVDVHVGCLAPPGPVGAELADDGVPTFACHAADARDFLALKRLSQHVRRLRPHLIHATLTHANVAARIVGRMQRIPIVSSTATIEVERYWHRALEQVTARLDRAHIVNSLALAEHVSRRFLIPRHRVRIVPPSIDPPAPSANRATLRRQLDIPPHEFVVAWVGRFDPVKRLDLLIRCAERLTTAPTRFLLVGDGPQRPTVEHWLRMSNAGRIAHLLGWRDNVPDILCAADAFLFPSLTEGMPNAVLEAMACGLPIVASDMPVLQDLAADGQRMLLVPGSQAARFADALSGLRADPVRARQLGRNAAAWARDNLDPRATIRALLRIYRGILPRSVEVPLFARRRPG
jgi:glycosyltransferase involved in cell wall biosynthesis